MKFTFLELDVNVVFSEVVEDGTNIFDVLVRVGRVNQYIINVCNDVLVEHVSENFVYEGLKHSWDIGKSPLPGDTRAPGVWFYSSRSISWNRLMQK